MMRTIEAEIDCFRSRYECIGQKYEQKRDLGAHW